MPIFSEVNEPLARVVGEFGSGNATSPGTRSIGVQMKPSVESIAHWIFAVEIATASNRILDFIRRILAPERFDMGRNQEFSRTAD